MPIRFSTQAANADKMNDDAGAAQGMPNALGADGKPRYIGPRYMGPRDIKADTANEAKPGKDINAPGFLKDNDPPN